jgi:glycerol-3-phosphate dehydrogenase
VDRSHVVFRFCGVRPLPRSDALTPGQISRDHSFPVLPPGNGINFPIYSLVGGKWTTFRARAEQVADEILRVLGRPRIRDSANLPIGGGKGYPRMPEHTTLPQERLATLVERYGTGADKVAAYLQAGPDAPLSCHSGYTRREIEFIARHEHVVHLDDLILRRTLMGMLKNWRRSSRQCSRGRNRSPKRTWNELSNSSREFTASRWPGDRSRP